MKNFKIFYDSIRGKNITLDCNIYLLFVIGSLGKEHIAKFKRTLIYSEDDYDLLIELIKDSNIIMTPNVLSEASNFLESYLYNGQKEGLKSMKILINKSKELYTASHDLSKSDSFLKFGLSDSSIFGLCKMGIVALTVDLPLYGFLITKSLPVINFNHLRVTLN